MKFDINGDINSMYFSFINALVMAYTKKYVNFMTIKNLTPQCWLGNSKAEIESVQKVPYQQFSKDHL